MKTTPRLILSFLVLTAALLSAQAQSNVVNVQVNLPGAVVSSNLFGVFFEEINMAGDGGIYFEQIRNRGFEDTTNINTSASYWTLATTGTATGAYSIDTSMPIDAVSNRQSLRLTMTGGTGTVGAVNQGYYGVHLTNGGTYNLGFYARSSNGFTGPLTATLQNTAGTTTYAQASVSTLTTNWQHFTYALVPNATDTNAELVMSIASAATIYLDVVSLFPAQTFNNRTNGLRPDLANMLVNLKPSFVRFPGGSWVDGNSIANAYHWELTVGDLGDRTPRTNVWGYMVDNGLGYLEYLQMCQDLGAAPLFCINCGMSGSTGVATNQLGPWIQEALNAIQYANGDTNTTWGAVRAADGHPAPFNLQYVEIGNEDSGSAYNANYGLFYNAIKSNYPSINLIGDSFGTIPTSAEVDFLDEHYYESASWFAQNSTHYDSYPRPGPKIFVGEYATGYGINFQATLQNAVGEAAWMTGMERNSDIVVMGSYAPLFCNINNQDWNPNLIYFNGTQVYGTPSYYVQQMFSANRGNYVLPTTVNAVTSGTIYVSSTFVQSSNLVILKAVNVSTSNLATTFALAGVGAVSPSATLVQLAGSTTASNSLASPTNVFPVTSTINNAGTNFTVTLPANSVSVFTLQASGISAPTNLVFQAVSNVNVGQQLQFVLFAELAGSTNLVNLAGNYGVSYSSSNTNIAIVSAGGVVSGAGLGATTIIATYDNLSVTQTVQVTAAPPTTLIHRYSFNDGTANDSIGNINGTFYNTSGNASIANGQLNLVGDSGDYVDFGPEVINTTNITTGAVTFEAWATFNAVNGAWARLFDFGNINGTSGGDYIFLAANNAANGGDARFAVSATSTGGNENGVTLANNFLGQTNIHVVAVFNPAPTRQFMGVYTNGVLAASASTGSMSIASLNDQFSFLGHSLWSSDAWLNGSIDEFRIYNGELNRFQIAASLAAGPNQTNYNVGNYVSFVVNPGPMPLTVSASSTASAYLNFTLATNVSVIGDPELTLTSGNPGIFTVNSSGLISAVGVGTASLTGVYDYISGNVSTLYTNTAQVTVSPAPPSTLVHRYSFSESGGTNTADSVGGPAWNGTLPKGGILTNGTLTLAASSSQYVLLPPGILSNYTAVTIDAWVSFGTLPANCFLFGFGNISGSSGEQYIFCQPDNGRIAITPSNYSGEQNTLPDPSGNWSGQTNLHITAVFDPPSGYLALYTNAVLAAINNAVTVPFTSVDDLYSYIGRSLYSADSYFNATYDEFRIYNGALGTNEIAASQILGPNSLLSVTSPTLSYSNSAGNLTLSWPLAAAGFTLMTETNLSSESWAPVSVNAQNNGSLWQVTVPVSGGSQFFRLQR